LRPGDRPHLEDILRISGAFSDEEIQVALDMADAGLEGEYDLLAIEAGGQLAGYACFGQAPLTAASWYLYWICVDRDRQGSGYGRALLSAVEAAILARGGARLVVETSGRADYARTRRFYERTGFNLVGCIEDFYKPDDDCLILSKVLNRMVADDI
jgi:ribosomal protein S18 acetylase RimI-like enzyme